MKTAKNLIEAINDGRERENKASNKLALLVNKHVKKHSQEIINKLCNELNEYPDVGQVRHDFCYPELNVDYKVMGGRTKTVYCNTDMYDDALKQSLFEVGIKANVYSLSCNSCRVTVQVEDLYNDDKDLT